MAQPSAHATAHADIVYPAAGPFLLVHACCLAAFWSGVSWRALALCAVLYWLRIFGIGAGYHRYFSHRAFATSRAFQFVLAFLAQSSAQSSVLWWASKHRRHYLHSDTPQDTHSALHRGLLYSHVGWIFDRPNVKADPDRGRRPRPLPGADAPAPPGARAGRHRGRRVLPRRGLVGGGGRLPLEHGAGLARHLLHQLAGAPSRAPALPDRRPVAQQLAAGDLHHGRGLAQQPPRPPEQRAPGGSGGGSTTPPSTCSGWRRGRAWSGA